MLQEGLPKEENHDCRSVLYRMRVQLQKCHQAPMPFMDNVISQEICLDVPYVLTPDTVVAEMLRIADVNRDDILYDLGSGGGRIVITAAKNIGARGVGIDINPQRIKKSWENAEKAEVSDRVKFLQDDLFKTDISEATVVTLYLLQEMNLRLRPKLLGELKAGTRIVSHDFSMGNWKSDRFTRISGSWDDHYVYYWIAPSNISGKWKWTVTTNSGKERYALRINQQFQEIDGIITMGAKRVSIIDMKLSGDRLQFTLVRDERGRLAYMKYNGQASGNNIKGTVESNVDSMIQNIHWEAKRDPHTIIPLDK